MLSRSPTSSGLSQNEKITLYVVAGVGGLLIIMGLAIGILHAHHQACKTQARVTQSILKKFPIIQYDCQSTPKSSFDESVDSFEEKEKACVETHITRNHNHTCPVCTEDFVQYQFLRVLPCGHQYHMKCIKDWLARGSNCPVCRVELKPETQKTAAKKAEMTPDLEQGQPQTRYRSLHDRIVEDLYGLR